MIDQLSMDRRFEKIRSINLSFLLFVTFLVGYGKVFEISWGSMGKRPETFLFIPLVLTIYLAVREKSYKWPITYREKVFIFYALFISMMPLWGLSLERSLDAVREFWAAAIFVILIMYNCRDLKELRLLIFAFLAGVILRSGLSIFQYMEGIDNLRASFRHYNVYGNFLLVPLSLLIGFLLYYSKGYKEKVIFGLAFILSGITLLASMSRAPFVALAFSLVLFSILVNRKVLMLVLLGSLGLALFIFFQPESAISKRVASIKWEDESFQSRVNYIWPIAIEIYKDHNTILGIGSGSYKKVFMENPKYKTQFKDSPYAHDHPHVHNDFLAALVAQGVIGASIYVFFIVQVILMSWKLFRYTDSGFLKALGSAGFLWIIAHFLAGIVHHEYTSSRYNMSVALMVTIVLLSYYYSLNSREEKVFKDK